MREEVYDKLYPFLEQIVDIICDHIETIKIDNTSEMEDFNIEMVLDQLEDYGKYKGLLRCEEEKCENYIPVSVAKQIVKGRGLGGVLGYMNLRDCVYENSEEGSKTIMSVIRADKKFFNDCKKAAEKYQKSKTVRDCSACKNNVEFPPPHTCDVCTSLDQEEEYGMWEAK